MTKFLVVPQWQGSPAARAMLLSDGAAAIAGDLPHALTRTLDIPLEAGESLGSGVQRKAALTRIRSLILDEIAPDAAEHTLLIGGDCSVSVAAIGALHDTSDLAVLWCDAQPDFHTPESSPTGAFAGMALRAVTGEGDSDLTLSPGISPDRVVLLGARDIDTVAQEILDNRAIQRLSIDALNDVDAVAQAVTSTGASRVYIHIDVDVLDPDEIEGLTSPVPFGASVAALTAAIKQLRTQMPLAGATVAGFAPRSPSDAAGDMGALLRLVGALA